MNQSNFDPSIFKAYDIRGVYGVNLDEDLSHRIGQAFAQVIQEEIQNSSPTVVVSQDMRLSSPQLQQAVVKGLRSMGVNVVDIGLASTPTFYFAVGYLKHDGGIQVSASHNPSEWNGFKMVRAKGVPISGDTGIYKIRDLVQANQFTLSPQLGTIVQDLSILDSLIHEQTKTHDLTKLKPLTIVADAANAMGALDLAALFATLPIKLIPINFELDGNFPSHEADPLKAENMKLLQQKVLENQADLGIATDGDGDRIFFVDNKGTTIPPEIIRGILAQMVLRSYPGAKIGFDIRPGKITKDMIVEAGGEPFITKVGHSLIKEAMLKVDSPFSGESSGHFYFKSDFGTFDSPIHVIMYLLEWYSEKNLDFAQAVQPLKKYFHSGEINSVVTDKERVFANLKTKYSDAKFISELDGVLIEYDDFWFNVRGSNTEPKIRLNLEAVSQEIMEQKRDEVLAIIQG